LHFKAGAFSFILTQSSTVMRFLQGVIACAPAFLLAACATVAPHTLSQTSIHDLKVVDVEISGAEVIRSWPAGEEAYARSPSADPAIVPRLQTSLVSDFPAVQAFIAGELKAIFKAEFDSQLRPIFAGQRPVRAFVHIKKFDVPSVARRMFLGGPAVFDAEVDLRDAKTGLSVLFYTGDYSSKILLGGLSAPIAAAIAGDQGRPLIQDFLQQYRDWLLRGAQS
jgi:hypothetical protein